MGDLTQVLICTICLYRLMSVSADFSVVHFFKKSGINPPLILGQYMHYALASYLENDTLAML